MSNQLWYFLLDGKYDENSGVFGSFFAHGTHCGEALHFAIEAARIQNILDPQAVEAERLDTLSEFVTPVDLVKVTDKASMKPNVHTFPLASEEKQFIPPKGIVKSTNDGGYDYSLIEDGFVAYGKNEEGGFEFELVAGIERLTTTFLQAIQILPRIELFYLCLKAQWEDDEEELWASGTISDTSDAVTFLTTHKENILENGHISCVVQESYGSTLTLDDHKKIKFRTSDENLFNEFGKKVMNLGFKQLRDLYNLEFGYHHWHYRPFNSLARPDFINLLKAEHFDRLDQSSEQ